MPSLDALQWTIAACAVIGLFVGYWLKIRPTVKRWGGGVDVLVGRKESVDPATGETLPEIQPLGIALKEMREDISVLTNTVAVVADQQNQIKDLSIRVTALESNKVEQIVTKAESAAMWQALANKDVIDVDPEP